MKRLFLNVLTVIGFGAVAVALYFAAMAIAVVTAR